MTGNRQAGIKAIVYNKNFLFEGTAVSEIFAATVDGRIILVAQSE